jgi:hypothetical protein
MRGHLDAAETDTGPQAPVPSLFHSCDDGPPAIVLAFSGALGVAHAFSGQAGDSFPVAGATLSFWLRTSQSDADAVIVSYGTATGNSGRLGVSNPASLTLHLGAAALGSAASTLKCNTS